MLAASSGSTPMTFVSDRHGDPGGQAPAAHRHEHRLDRPGVLAQDLEADRALARDHVEVVVGVDEGEALRRLEVARVRVGLVEGVPVQHGLGAPRAHRLDLDRGGGARHDHDRRDAEPLGGERHPLGVVAGGRADHAARQRLRVEPGDAVVGAAQLERVHGLEVLALEAHGTAEPGGEPRQRVEGRLHRHVVDAGGEHALDEVLHGRTLHGGTLHGDGGVAGPVRRLGPSRGRGHPAGRHGPPRLKAAPAGRPARSSAR
jgi:hypothetical protein